MPKCIKHTCKDCIHFKICNDYKYLIGREDKVACPDFKATEDVVPRSEVEKLIVERETYKAHSYNVQTLLNTINQKIAEGYELSAAKACAEMEMWQRISLEKKQLTDRIDNLIKNYAECQKEFAWEIISEFKNMVINYVKDRDLLLVAFKNAVAYAEAELKKKYIGE